MKTVITFGTFDMFHIGHLRLLQRAKSYGDRLVVGLSTDQLNKYKKGRLPVCRYDERFEILSALSVVDAVFAEESLEMKRHYIIAQKAVVLVMGDDWEGRFDSLSDVCEIVYLRRTPSISTTALIEKIRA